MRDEVLSGSQSYRQRRLRPCIVNPADVEQGMGLHGCVRRPVTLVANGLGIPEHTVEESFSLRPVLHVELCETAKEGHGPPDGRSELFRKLLGEVAGLAGLVRAAEHGCEVAETRRCHRPPGAVLRRRMSSATLDQP